MLDKEKLAGEFFYRFTKEILIEVKKQIDEEQSRLDEEERGQKALEIEKLKNKYSQYLKTDNRAKSKINVATFRPIIPSPNLAHQRQEIKKAFILKPDYKEKLERERERQKRISLVQQEPISFGNTLLAGINFGRIATLVKNPYVEYIECPGEGKNIMIKRDEKITPTTIILSKQEIKSLVESFSEKTNIPIVNGLFNAEVSNIELSAALSDNSSSSFIIRKPRIQSPQTTTVYQQFGSAGQNNQNQRDQQFSIAKTKSVYSNEPYEKSIMNA